MHVARFVARVRRLEPLGDVLTARVGDAAAGDATEAGQAGVLSWLTALLHAGGTVLLDAARRQLRLSDADLARVARIDAGLYLGAWFAFRRIAYRIQIAATDPRWIFRSEPHGVGEPVEFAAAEAVASVGSEGAAVVQACLGLRRISGAARPIVTRNVCIGIVFALAALGRIVRAHFERIALVAPEAIVVSGAGVLIEVAIRLAR